MIKILNHKKMTICHIMPLLFNYTLKFTKITILQEQEMLDFIEIMSRIRKILSDETGKKIYDKDIANALGFKASYYAVIKRRHKIPYKAIALFADKKALSLNWIFFNKQLP